MLHYYVRMLLNMEEKKSFEHMLSKGAIRDLEFDVAHMRESYPRLIIKSAKITSKQHLETLEAYQPKADSSVSYVVPQSVFAATIKDQPDLLQSFDKIKCLQDSLKQDSGLNTTSS